MSPSPIVFVRVYLDTSVINFVYAEDAPDFRKVTLEFFSDYAPKCELFYSPVLVDEILNDPVIERRSRHFAILEKNEIILLPSERDNEVTMIADSYISAQVVSDKQYNDALHVAYATVFEMDVLLSWNFKHLANLRREAAFALVNQTNGYKRTPRIISPMEMFDEK